MYIFEMKKRCKRKSLNKLHCQQNPLKAITYKACIKRQIVIIGTLSIKENFPKFQLCFALPWFHWSLENVLASPYDQKCPLCTPVSQSNVTSAAAFKYSANVYMEIFIGWSSHAYSCQTMKLKIWCWWTDPYKTIAKFILQSKIILLRAIPWFCLDFQIF